MSAERDGTSMASYVKGLAQYSDPLRYRFAAWFLGTDGPLREELAAIGVDSAYRPWHGWRDVRGAWRAGLGMHNGGFRIVHRHTGGRSVGTVIRLSSRAPVVTHLHATGPEEPNASNRQHLRPGTDFVIANSRAHPPVRDLPIEVVHPGTDTARFRPHPIERHDGAAIIGVASRLVPVKAVHHVLEAFALVHDEFPDTRLEIAGDGPEQPSLERQCSKLGIAGTVTFLGWQTEMELVMSRWTVFAQSSLSEGFGISALEAMAMGLPVVATDVGGVGELVVHGVTGALVPASEPAAMANALTTLLRSPARAVQLGEAGRKRAIDQFDVRRMVEKVTAVYERLLPA